MPCRPLKTRILNTFKEPLKATTNYYHLSNPSSEKNQINYVDEYAPDVNLTNPLHPYTGSG